MGNKGSTNRQKQQNGDPLATGSTTSKSGGLTDGGNGSSSMKRSKSVTYGGVSSSSTSGSVPNRSNSSSDMVSGAVPYRDGPGGRTTGDVEDRVDRPSEPRQMEIKIYRSYTNVAEASKRAEPRPNVRVYRRNTQTARNARGEPAERSQTLPRGFGRYRSATTSDMGSRATVGAVVAGDMATMPRGRRASGSQSVSASDLKRHSSVGMYSGSGGGGLGDSRGSRRSASMSSMASIGYKVSADDFPDTATIKRRLAQFESNFTRNLVELYANQPESIQLAALSIAVRPGRANQHVSLWQYFNMPEIPLDLNQHRVHQRQFNDDTSRVDQSGGDIDDYVLTIQPALFNGLMHVRHDRPGDQDAALAVACELVSCLAAESAAELARIFEYQIALLSDGMSIELLASQAARCVVDYIRRSGRHLDRNTIVVGAIRGQHVVATGVSPKLSVIVGQRELKWEIHEILKKPGLRRELSLFSANVQVDEENPPWTFRTSDRHDPMLYGYRGLIVDWDYTAEGECSGPSGPGGTWTSVPLFRLNGEDEAMFTDEMDWRPDDFHRSYCPYRRLVGAGVMHQFASQQTSTSPAVDRSGTQLRSAVTLAEHLKRLHGELYSRDQVQPICRPITSLGGGGRWTASDAAVPVGRRGDVSADLSTVDDVFSVPRPVSASNSIASADVDHRGLNGRPSPSSSSPAAVLLVVTPTSPQTATVQPQTPPAAASGPPSSTSSAARTSPTASADSERFVDAPAASDWSPLNGGGVVTVNQNNFGPDCKLDNGNETLVVDTVVTRCNDVNAAVNGNGRDWNGHDESVITITHHVTVSSKDVGTYRPTPDGRLTDSSYYETDSNGLMYFNGDAPMKGVPFNYVIEENTRKTIRSDI